MSFDQKQQEILNQVGQGVGQMGEMMAQISEQLAQNLHKQASPTAGSDDDVIKQAKMTLLTAIRGDLEFISYADQLLGHA